MSDRTLSKKTHNLLIQKNLRYKDFHNFAFGKVLKIWDFLSATI